MTVVYTGHFQTTAEKIVFSHNHILIYDVQDLCELILTLYSAIYIVRLIIIIILAVATQSLWHKF